MKSENTDPTTETVIKFRSADIPLYNDDTVRLIDESHRPLIRRLHEAFAPFQKLCPFRDAREGEERLTDTSYEDEYQKMNMILTGKVWKTMDLDTAGSLIGFGHCLNPNEILALVPFHFEILLRAEAWVWPFELVILHFCREKKQGWSDYQKAYQDTMLRQLVHDALEAIQTKFENDSEFKIHEIAPEVNEAIRDWAP